LPAQFSHEKFQPMANPIFDKTEKGREEISTRKHHLASRLRTLLLLIDGKQHTDEVLKKVAGLGLNQDNIAELLNQGFIHPVASATAPAETSVPLPLQPASVLPEGETQFEAIYHFYTQTIKSMIGLRGYGLQLKVERASSIAEFRELRQPYLEAVLKAKGSEIARSLQIRLDQLLDLDQTPGTSK